MQPHALSSRGYSMLWLMLSSLVLCIAIAYVFGTQAAASTLFDVWMYAWFVPVWIIPLFRYRDHRQPGAIPATVAMVAYILILFVLGTVVLGTPCPGMSLPHWPLPGLR
jgi:hypothetical protein